jgi:hypothetical protein
MYYLIDRFLAENMFPDTVLEDDNSPESLGPSYEECSSFLEKKLPFMLGANMAMIGFFLFLGRGTSTDPVSSINFELSRIRHVVETNSMRGKSQPPQAKAWGLKE